MAVIVPVRDYLAIVHSCLPIHKKSSGVNSFQWRQQFSFQIPWYGVVKVRTVGWGKSAGVWGAGSEALVDEAHEMIPVVEGQVLQQGALVFE